MVAGLALGTWAAVIAVTFAARSRRERRAPVTAQPARMLPRAPASPAGAPVPPQSFDSAVTLGETAPGRVAVSSEEDE